MVSIFLTIKLVAKGHKAKIRDLLISGTGLFLGKTQGRACKMQHHQFITEHIYLPVANRPNPGLDVREGQCCFKMALNLMCICDRAAAPN